MALIKSVRGFTPKIGKDTFLADNATIIGDVEIGEGCSIWFGTVVRGDVNSIRIGNGVNIQDGSVLHTLYEKSVIEIGDDVRYGSCRNWRRSYCCCRICCIEQYDCRTRKYLCRCSGEVRQESRSGTVEGN